MLITAQMLDSYLGLSMADICSNGYVSAAENHCAHFVCHALQLDFGVTCRQLVGRHQLQAAGANVRVQEVFARCPHVEELLACPTFGTALIFISAPGNFRGTPVALANVPKKHIGILHNGTVWHYSNSRSRVVTQTVSDFMRHYPTQTNALWLGDFPADAAPQRYAGLSCSA